MGETVSCTPESLVNYNLYPHHRDFFSNYWEELEKNGINITEDGMLEEDSYDKAQAVIEEYYRRYVQIQLDAAIRFRDGINRIEERDLEPMPGDSSMCMGSDATWLVRHYSEIVYDINLINLSNEQYVLRQAGKTSEADEEQKALEEQFEKVRQEVLVDLENAKNLVMHDVRFTYARFIDTYGPIEDGSIPENTIIGAVQTIMGWLTAPNERLINVGIVEDDFCGETHKGEHCLLVHGKDELVGRDKFAMEKLLRYLEEHLGIDITYKTDQMDDDTWHEVAIGDSGNKVFYKYHPVSGVIRNVILPIGIFRRSVRSDMAA